MNNKLSRHFTVSRLTKNSAKFIFSESLRTVDNVAIFILSKNVLFSEYSVRCPKAEAWISSSFPVGFEREKAIHITMSSEHLSLKKLSGNFDYFLGFFFDTQLNLKNW